MQEVGLQIVATGAVTPVGLTTRAFAAACRAGVSGVAETRFRDQQRQWLRGAVVPSPQPLAGVVKLKWMGALAVAECLQTSGADAALIDDVYLCVSEHERPGRPRGLDDALATELARVMDRAGSRSRMHIVAAGKVGVAAAVAACRTRLSAGAGRLGLILAVDSLIGRDVLAAYESEDRLLTGRNSNGFIPGEAACAILVAAAASRRGDVTCAGVAVTREEAKYGSEIPLRGDGLTAAVRQALLAGGVVEATVDFRIADLSGEQYYFREASLLSTRLFRAPRAVFPLWLPAESTGETGAAAGALSVAWFVDAVTHGYSPGSTAVCHCSDAGGGRAAMVLTGERTHVE